MSWLRGLGLAVLAGCPPANAPISHDTEKHVLAHHQLDVSDLPAPVDADTENPPNVIARPSGASLTLPLGFSAEVFATGFGRPRGIAVAENGDVFVVESDAGTIIVLREKERITFARDLELPFGLAFTKGFLYVGTTSAVVRFPYQVGQTTAGAPERIATLPGGGYRQHWTRNVAISPNPSPVESAKLYVTVGSQSNVNVEPPPRASILEMNLDGSGLRTFASGTRNPVGLAFHPTTGALWASVQERDLLGDDLVPDYVTEVKDGGFYGWPFGWAGGHEDPRRKGEAPDRVKQIITPDVMVQAHSAVLGMAFYDAQQFPAEYRGDLFVAFHGSWNRSKRTGQSIARIRMKDGHAVGGWDDFCTGWMLGEDVRDVWGRPVGIAVAKDGALLVTDDGAGSIWRISFSSSGR
jgi:glucose/arabinose dehydrogenase